MSTALLEWMAIAFMLAALGNVILIIYVSHKKLDLIETYFKDTKIVIDTKAVWGNAGFVGKVHRSGMIFITILFASQWHKKGLVNLGEVAALPLTLKRWICIPMIASPILIAVTALLLKLVDRL